jgi:hypothetical protein
MAETESLTPVEARGLRRRRTVQQVALGCYFAIVCVAMFALAPAWEHAWILVAIPGAAGCLFLHVRGVRCPRCRCSVYGPRPADDSTYHAGDPMVFAPPFPPRCRTCCVRLIPAESKDQVSDPAEPGGSL